MKALSRLVPTSFGYLNATQFLGALNDNIFKLLIVFLLVHVQGKAHSNTIVTIVGFAFVVPFILFSIPAGTLADRYSKRNLIVLTKVMELITMTCGVLTFWLESAWGSYTVLFSMGTQSALFGPSKYGIIPELVRRDQIAGANGILAACTVLAIIFGTFIASFITQITNYNFVGAALLCVGIAVLGLGMSLLIHKTPAVGTKRPLSWRVVTECVRVLRRSRRTNYLFASFIGVGFFYFAGAFIQLNILTYALQSLNLTEVGGGYLFLIAAAGIATGAFIAGKISGDRVELGLASLTGLVMAGMMFGLYATQYSVIGASTVLFFLGLFGGMFLLPFEAYIQAGSPEKDRGENVAGGNFLSFVFILAATALLGLLGTVLGLTAAQGFVVLGLLSLFLSIGLARRTCDTLVRLVSRWRYRGKHRIVVEGLEFLPRENPCLILCPTRHWDQALIALIGMQQHYCRFLVERGVDELSFSERTLLRTTKSVLFDTVPEKESRAAQLGTRYLQRGYTLFVLYREEEYRLAPRPRIAAAIHSLVQPNTPVFEAILYPPISQRATTCVLSQLAAASEHVNDTRHKALKAHFTPDSAVHRGGELVE